MLSRVNILLTCVPQLDDQAGIGKPTDYTPVVTPVNVGLNNSYLFTGLSLEVRA